MGRKLPKCYVKSTNVNRALKIPSYTSYTYEYAATAYYYGMNGETACTDIGGTYTAG